LYFLHILFNEIEFFGSYFLLIFHCMWWRTEGGMIDLSSVALDTRKLSLDKKDLSA